MTVTVFIRYQIDPFKRAEFEAYRARLRQDPESLANFQTAETGRFILAEERTFLRPVE